MPTINPTPRLLLFTLVRTVANTAHRMVYPYLSAFARGLGVELSVLSNLMSTRALVGMIAPLAAALADRAGRKVGILAGLGLFTLGAAVVVVRQTFTSFAAALLLMTLGKNIADISLVAWVGDRVPYARRGRALALIEFGWSLSFIVGVPLVGFLIARRGWDAPFLLFALLGGLGFIVMTVIIPREAPQVRAAAPANGRMSLASLLRSKAVVPVLACLSLGIFSTAANETVNLVFGVWLEDSFGLQLAALGAASIVIGASEMGGEGLVALYVDRLGKRRAVALGLVLNALAALALPWLGRSEVGALGGLFTFYLWFEFTIVSSIPLMTEVLPSARATMLALNVAGLSLGRALGAFSGARLYTLGFPAVVIGAAAFNLLALLALWQMKQVD